MHRSTIGSDAESMKQLLKFFELIGQKPIVDLKMDSLTNIQCIDELAQAFTSNTAIRNKSRVGKLSMLMYVHQKLKERQQGPGNLGVQVFREISKYTESSN